MVSQRAAGYPSKLQAALMCLLARQLTSAADSEFTVHLCSQKTGVHVRCCDGVCLGKRTKTQKCNVDTIAAAVHITTIAAGGHADRTAGRTADSLRQLVALQLAAYLQLLPCTLRHLLSRLL